MWEKTMLKIKDSVDLKELEKFGFKYRRETATQYEHYVYETRTENDFYPVARCWIWCCDRCIAMNTREIEIIYDLIQADMVEKVGE